jgi:hypothetical protein
MEGISVPEWKDKHETLSFSAPLQDTMEASTPITDTPYDIKPGNSVIDDSGIEMSAAELTDIEGTNREQILTNTLPNLPYDPYIPENVQELSMDAIQPDFIGTGQLHTPVSQFLSQEAEEEDISELQEETHHDVDSAYDADSIRDNDTETLASFITNYRWENGRRYHAYSDGAYWVWVQSKE